MDDSELENELRRLQAVPPSLSLEGRIAAALPSAKVSRLPWARWLVDRLLWTAGGAVTAWLMMARAVAPPIPVEAAPASHVSTAPRISEEPLAWSDEGVQLFDGGTPARLLRRLVMERHLSADGTAEVQVPREDVILLPVALR